MPIAKSSKGRIKIKPFSRPPKLPPDFYETTSRELLKATACILNENDGNNNKTLQHCYNSVVNLVSHQFGPKLYQDLVSELTESSKRILLNYDGSGDLLVFLQRQYPKYVRYLLLVRHVFMALDRPYVWDDDDGVVVKRTTTTSSSSSHATSASSSSSSLTATTILEVGLKQFHKRLVELQWDAQVFEAWWTLLWSESFMRDDGTTDILSDTMGLWKDLGVARQILQQTQPRLQQSFAQLSVEWQEKNQPYNPEAFLEYAHAKWHFVSTQWSSFLPKMWLRTLLEIHLVEPHLNDTYLLKELNITHLDHCQRLWLLAGRIEGGLARVMTAVCALVKQRGFAAIQDDSSPKQVITTLLQLHEQLQALKGRVGDSIPLKSVWTEILNQTPLVAEWLAKYIDLEFKNFKSDTSLEPLLYLFIHLQAKDVFEAFYKKDLAKRLLLNKVHSMDLERQFVSLLKTECGAGYTSKMEGMFQDMEFSRESLKSYKETTTPEAAGGVDMEVQILTTGYWPVYPQFTNLVLPEELTSPQAHFWNYYKTKYQGRKIVWQYALGNCTVKFKSTAGKTFEFVVSLCQTLVLACFNEKPQWTLPELMRRVGIDDRDEVERTLLSMSQGKEQHRILARKRIKKDAATAAADKPAVLIPDDDAFLVNEKFASNMRRIKIPNILKKETKEERDKVVEGVSRDRLYLIDAVLVRILKARKTILHQQLISQVLEQVKVPAQPADIKKRIESLIEREYMERDQKERNRYNYLA